MPTLRRSKSLNDKISRQKNRSGDVIRDPRSPDVEGRTRTCVDNFQALVHLRKQTEDKARQLELAYSYATNGHTFLRQAPSAHGPSGGVPLPYPSSTSTATKPPRHHDPAESKPPASASVVHRRQHSAEGRTERERSAVVRRQESFSGSQHQSRREQKKAARPMSMVEPRGGSLFPSQDEVNRKDQVIQNLTESQRSLNLHNQKLLSKIDELEFENNRLRDILNAHNVQFGTYSQSHFPSTRAQRSISLHGDAIRVCSVPSSTVVSPHSETSVSGYGSLADSPSGEGFLAGPDIRMVPRTAGVGDYDDDTLPLSGVSECSLEYKHDTLAQTSSSSSSSRRSRGHTLNLDSDSTWGEKMRREMEEPEGGEGWGRIEDLAKQVAELSSQRDTVILRYKQLVEDNLRVLKRDKRVREDLGCTIEKHRTEMSAQLSSYINNLAEQLKDSSEDVQSQVQSVLNALDSASSEESTADSMDPQVHDMLTRLLDLIAPDYQRLGRRLTVPQQELDKIESHTDHTDHTHTHTHMECPYSQESQAMLRAWLRRRGGAESDTVPPAAKHLDQALRDVDKDLQHCQFSPVSSAERQTLRNCLQFAIDHVVDPRDVLDHLIALNELSPPAISFVQEVVEKRERAVCRLWHVSEYRATGIVSRLALALDRSHCSQVAHRLRDELEIQNSRILSQCHPARVDPAPMVDCPTPPVSIPVSTPISIPIPTTTPSPDSQLAVSQARSRPISRVPRFRSKTMDSAPHPVQAPPVPDNPALASQRTKPPPLRQISQTRKEKEGSSALKERPTSVGAVKPAPSPADRSVAVAKKETSRTSQPSDRRILASSRDRPFSYQRPAAPNAPRPFSPLRRDGVKSENVSQSKHSPASQTRNAPSNTQRERPFSPVEKEMSARPFSPFDKDKQTRPFSPFDKDKQTRPFSPIERLSRPFSPLDKNKVPRPYSPLEKEKVDRASEKDQSSSAAQNGNGKPTLHTQTERPFSPFHKDRPVTTFQKDRALSNAQSHNVSSQQQRDKQTVTSGKERSTPPPPKEKQAVWDKRSNVGASTAQNNRNSVVLEQGGKISRV